MAIGTISDAEVGSSVRTKLNAAIAAVNASGVLDITLNAGDTINANALVFLDYDNSGDVFMLDADSSSGMNCPIGFNKSGARTIGQSTDVQVSGIWTTSALSYGRIYYASQTAGAITSTKPSSPAYARPVGIALSATELLILQDMDTLEAVSALESIIIAVGDETSSLTTGTAKVKFRMPYAFTLSDVKASVNVAPTGAALQVDINEAGTSVLSTIITIDTATTTSESAGTQPVISDSALAADAEMSIDIDQVGSTVPGQGLKVVLIGTQA